MTNGDGTFSCGDLEQALPAAWKGELGKRDQEALDRHIAGCAACRALATDLEAAWLSVTLDDVTGPGPDLRDRVMAAAGRAFPAVPPAMPSSSAIAPPATPWWKLAAAAAVFVAVGVGLGRAWPDTQMQEELAFLRDELRTVRHVMTLSLIQQASATERLQAVATAALIDQPDAQVRDALLEALASDGNVNVRLAAIDALRGLATDQRVGAQLIDSAGDQDSPMVQVAVIDALVERKQRSAEPALRAIANDAKAAAVVRERARWALGQLQGSST
jgi:hypothetical protein